MKISASTATPARQAAADAAISLARAAAQANVKDVHRRGAVIELGGAGDCLISGDLHGNLGNFQRVLAAANLPRFRERHLVLQELVHEVDNAASDLCFSYRLVELAARLKTTFPDRVHIIMGNHEFAELLDFGVAKNRRNLNEAFDAGLERAYDASWPRVKDAYKEFWRSLPLAVRGRNGLFVCHSTPSRQHLQGMNLDYLHSLQPGEGLERNGPVYHLLWDRDYAENTAAAFATSMWSRTLVVAHTPCEDGHEMPNSRTLLLDSKDSRGCYALIPLDASADPNLLATSVHRVNSGAPMALAAPAPPTPQRPSAAARRTAIADKLERAREREATVAQKSAAPPKPATASAAAEKSKKLRKNRRKKRG